MSLHAAIPRGLPRPAADVLWIGLAAAVLLIPALVYGRPFVFGDTTYYWTWGGDILDALRRPWPPESQPWIWGRTLHGWGFGLHDATREDLRFNLTWLTARSAFYAVPFHLLVTWGGLWAPAVVQAVVTAWALRVAVAVLAPAAPPSALVGVAAGLTGVSSLGFEIGYAMPDVFGGLALLAAALTMAAGERLGRADRFGLVALMAYGVLAHAENALGLAAACLIGLVVSATPGRRLRAIAPSAAALALGLAIAAGGAAALGWAFGHAVSPPPFPAARLLADGAVQPYLQRVCGSDRLAACDLAARPPAAPEYYLWTYPLEPPAPSGGPHPLRAVLDQFDRLSARHVTNAQANQRERFVAEQGRLVVGALETDGPGEAQRALAATFAAAANFAVGFDFDSARFLAAAGPSRLGNDLASIMPGHRLCLQPPMLGCGRFDTGLVAPLQDGAVLAAIVVLALGATRSRLAPKVGLARFAVLALCMTFANAALCGALSGPYARYQSRVEWLIPLSALLLLLQWAARPAQAPQGSGKASGRMVGASPDKSRA